MEASAILQPVIALGLWTGVVMIWMFVTRISWANSSGLNIQDAAHTREVK